MEEGKDVNFYVESPSISEPAWIPVAKWVRVRFGNEIIADSKKVMLKRPYPLIYYFPKADVKMEFLDKSGKKDEKEEWGTPELWNVKTGAKEAGNAAFSYEESSDEAPEEIKDYIAFKWNEMDAWLEEDEEVLTHARDPYHRIDVCYRRRHVKIEIAGETVAETDRPVLLFETGLPVRYYIPTTDVRLDLLKSTDHRTECPYKGIASYYSVNVNGDERENIIWTYPFPNNNVMKIKNLLAFFTERLDDVFIDGERLPKANTKWR
ncbi:MAG: DUF427 domain-containing protein [Bacteroidota bacterium]